MFYQSVTTWDFDWQGSKGWIIEVTYGQFKTRQQAASFGNSISLFHPINGDHLFLKDERVQIYRIEELAQIKLLKLRESVQSFVALNEGLQNALWRCGGSPTTHRTDSLSAAYRNEKKLSEQDLTDNYQQLCRHYRMEPTRNNRGRSPENGAIESPHGHFKRRLHQALLMRGSADFACVMEPTRNNRGRSPENGAIESPHGHFKRRLHQALLMRGSADFACVEEYQQLINQVVGCFSALNW